MADTAAAETPSYADGWSSEARAPATAVETGQWVTLLTGDRVYVDGDRIAVEPAKGREHIGFSQYEFEGRQNVVPNDALRLVSAGQLDERLFDVTGLVEAGYDDERVEEVPTIVEYDDPAGVATLRATDGVQVDDTLHSVDGAAVSVDKDDVASFWDAVTSGPDTELRTASGISKIWLDGKREVSLDVSVPQIGTSAAWEAGYDGSGVTVAILDTGIDADHPDLADSIAAAENFTDAPDTSDNLGHGTHVASTVAGSGAASDGRYRGVAPGADLIIGKVCPDRFCSESAILAGMEWAAPRADVINMSLGGWDNPGIDPLEAALNRLTAETGVLFVAAAGNESREGGVGSPASADAALAVGAVDKQENLASFSNRGPRTGDGAIKPDVTAPGVGIVAALSGNSAYPEYEPGYTQLNGTSMASPHVAGAAALLAQQHPDWAAGDLKAALMASATPNPDLNPFQQGAGRVDLGRAIGQAVLPSVSSLALGSQAWPAEDDTPVTETVTYRNAGSEPVTLDIAAQVTGPDGNPAPDGMFTVTPSQVTVPAGGTADVALTADTRVPSVTGTFGGALVASSADGVSVRVPLTIAKDHEMRDLTIRLIDRDGAPASNYSLNVIGVDLPTIQAPYDASGTVTVRLRPGFRYYIRSTVITPSDGSSTLLAQPSLEFDGDSDIVLDARAGTPVSVSVPHPTARSRWASAGLARSLPSGYYLVDRVMADTFDNMYTADLGDEVTEDEGTLTSDVRGFFAEPGPDGTFFDSPYEYDLVWFERGRFLTDFSRTVEQSELATVVNRSYAVTGNGGQGFMHNFGFPPEGGSAVSGPIRFSIPSTRTIYYTADDVSWQSRWNQLNSIGQAETQQYAAPVSLRAGRRYVTEWQQGPAGPTFNEQTYLARVGNTMIFNLPPFGDQAGHTGYSLLDTGRVSFYVDDTKLVDIPRYFYDAQGPVPPAESTYRLEYEVDRTTGFTNSTEISGSWTFKSSEVGTEEWTYLPLASFAFAPDLDLANSAPGGRPLAVPVSLTRQPGAATPQLRSVTVEVSYDEGATWKKVPLAPTGRDTWVTRLRHPRAGTVSFRAGATFADDSTADYTVIRAYELR